MTARNANVTTLRAMWGHWLPLARPAVGLAVGLATLGLLLHLGGLPPADGPLHDLLMLGAGAVLLIVPAITAVFAALHTARHAASHDYQLLRLTALSPRTLTHMHVISALRAVRFMAGLAMGLTPALVLGMAQRTSRLALAMYPAFPFGAQLFHMPPPVYGVVNWRLAMLGWAPEFTGWAVGLWGAVLCGAALGVALALWWRQGVLAATVAALTITLLNVGMGVLLVLLPLEQVADSVRVGLVLAAALTPYTLGLLGLRIMQRWA